MNKDEFRKHLLDRYRPPTETDEHGGYLIPRFITEDKAGKLAAFYRAAGRFLRSPRIYEMGTYQFDLYTAILKRVEKASNE